MERNLNLNYDSPTEIRILLEMMGLGPRKRWGQNFLINPGARAKIVSLLKAESGDIVWEIGPGLGAMTGDILSKDVDLTAFEIDPGYCEYLKMAYGEKGLKLIQGDVMDQWKTEWEKQAPVSILGNLPYNAASAIIGNLLESNCIPSGRMVFLVQKEMGDRMTAACNSKDYSSFSILCQYSCKIEDGGTLNPGSFYPAPRVSSKIIVMSPLNRERSLSDHTIFVKLVRGVFSSRRKTLRNNIKRMASQGFMKLEFDSMESIFKGLDIDLDRRPETLSVENYVDLANGFASLVNSSLS